MPDSDGQSLTPARAPRAAVPPGTPAWVTPELVEKTSQFFLGGGNATVLRSIPSRPLV